MSLTPHENDVILGRGRLISAHSGNVRFRSLVSQKKETYSRSINNKSKRGVALSIVEEIESLNPPGRFLIEKSGTKLASIEEGEWIHVEKEKAIEKALHCLREKDKGGNNSRQRKDKQPTAKGVKESTERKSSGEKKRPIECDTRPILATSNQLVPGNQNPPEANDSRLFGNDPYREVSPGLTESSSRYNSDDSSVSNYTSTKPLKHPSVILEDRPSTETKLQLISPSQYHPLEYNSANQGHGFDDDFNSFLLSHFHDDVNFDEREKLTLRQWIDASKLTDDSTNAEYVILGLSIAVKIIEHLIRAERNEEGSLNSESAISVEALEASNVIVTLAQVDFLAEDIDLPESMRNNPNKINSLKKDLISKGPSQRILSVDFALPEGTDPNVWSISSRLVALGSILYEIFSKGDRFELKSILKKTRSVKDIRLSCDGHSDDGSISTGQRSKKSTPCPGDDRFAHLIMRLGNIGIPHPVINLVENLLNSSLGEFSGDDVYRSLDDVRVDLQLMIDDPSRYLDSSIIEVNQTLSISDEMYGREEEIARLRDAYNRFCDGVCNGALILGEGGVGKSTFAMNAKKFTIAANGYFVSGKFDRNATRPFMVIGDVFNSMCDLFAADIQSIEQERKMAEALTKSLGRDAFLIANIVPNLSNLMPLYTSCESSSFDAASRTRYLLLTLLDTLSKLSKSITILLDDLQWIDPASLTFCRALFQSTKSNKNVFLVLCSRESEVQTQDKSEVHDWLQSLSGSTLETIRLTNLNPEDVNNLVSDSLRTWPRLTRSLSAILHGKSLGNPFFLRQTMEMLCRGGYLHYSLGERKWKWDLDEISDLRLDDNVVSLLTREMTKLPDELLVGLKAASCIGYCIPQTVVDILSKHLEMDLFGVLTSLVQRSYLAGVGSALYRFTHDRIYQAAYELMSEKQRREDHMKFGLAICSYVLDNCENNYDMMFVGVNQINRGGPEVLADSCRRVMISQLNLNAGKRALLLTDFSSALSFFGHGIMFLNPGHWDVKYHLTLNLFTAAAESACALSDAALVKSYSETILAHSRSLDDRLPALCFAVKSLKESMNLPSCRDCAIEVLTQLGEDVSSVLEIPSQETIQITNNLLMSKMTDDSMIKMSPCTQMRAVFVMRLYHELNYVYYVFDQTRLLAISLRMVSLTFEIGLTDTSSLAFANYGVELIARGYLIGSRLGTVALKLAENSKYISYVIAAVKQYNYG